MTGKGSKRRPRDVDQKVFMGNWDAIFTPKELECPSCKEITLRPTCVRHVWECTNCKLEIQF
jgi:uncharacterized protein (DUF983 family)